MNLKEARIRNFLSMAKLSDKAKVSVATIRDVEGGRHNPSLSPPALSWQLPLECHQRPSPSVRKRCRGFWTKPRMS